MKIRLKLTLTTVTTVIFTSIFSGLIIYLIINNGFTNFLNAQIKLIENHNLGPGIRKVLGQLKDYHQLINKFNRTLFLSILFSSSIGIGIGIVISYILSSRIVTPIHMLISKIKIIRNHDYSNPIEIDGGDEISQLGNEFEKLRKDLLTVETLRKDLVSDLAHELNTPLTTIKGIVEGIEENVYIADESHILIIKEEIDNLSGLINRMRHFNEIRTRKYQSKADNFDINIEIKAIIKHFEKHITKKNQKFLEEFDPEVSITNININRLSFNEIVTNLISNAVKYSPQNTNIELTTLATNDRILVKVKDNGKGIDESMISLIFERFFRVDKSRNKNSGGMGLGLAIVKELVEACNFTITVESTVGQGTTFILTIPLL